MSDLGDLSERIREYRLENLAGQAAIDYAFHILNGAIEAYAHMDDPEAIWLETLAQDGKLFSLYFAIHPDAARQTLAEHRGRHPGARDALWQVTGRLVGNPLYRWKYEGAQRAMKRLAATAKT
ncbi:MAG: hypothetical protein EXR58_05685 [Chloroflexi bacterium]|nr:hypothetical protein [Chloroflexota bacterium]